LSALQPRKISLGLRPFSRVFKALFCLTLSSYRKKTELKSPFDLCQGGEFLVQQNLVRGGCMTNSKDRIKKSSPQKIQ
jgi:hypothetical protein